MARTLRGSIHHGHWNWCQKRDCSNLLCRDGPRSYPWGFGHVLAAVGGCRFVTRLDPIASLLIISSGIFLGFCANVIVKDTGRIAWRLQLGSAFIPSFILAAGIWFCPESPRWLMKNGKHAKAFRSMSRLRAHPIIAARDYYYSCVIFEEEKAVAGGSGYFTRMWDCFAVPRIRRANYGASTVMIAQQMCGINSKSIPSIGAISTRLTLHSHFFLQLNNLRRSWIHSHTSSVRLTWLRCHSGRLNYTHCIHDRHQRT